MEGEALSSAPVSFILSFEAPLLFTISTSLSVSAPSSLCQN
jgi:hypothetical protein